MLCGSTMALFTSLERMQKVIAKARIPLEKEGISVLGGDNSSKRADLEHFQEDKNAVLFGSRGFFEGVDISGPALRCKSSTSSPSPTRKTRCLRPGRGTWRRWA
jgi:Rad3-related DNA helicase